ncbi:hypothetical protein Tco_0654500 [Tanacetum coccineum]|uniref:Uncharacterized protein n=1 Tax=Tanacetum coccineum TaxID=301880 RepID=A0ABQ4X4C3_9ASTR
MSPTTTEEKAHKRLEVKARSTLMIGIPNEHQLKFNLVKDAKLLMEVVEKRFGGNATTEKTQRNLLKQQYENFTAPSLEMLGSSLSTQNMAFVSSSNNNNSSTNGAVSTAQAVNIQPNNPQLAHEDLQQIHPDDLEEMDLRWQMAMLTMRARRFLKNIECRAPRNQDYKNKESTKRTVPMEISTSTALVSCDGLSGYDQSDQAEEGPNYALMAYSSSSSDSEISNNSNCSKSYLKIVETLKSQYDQLHKDFKKSELMVLAYKSGLESVEEKLEVYKANESVYSQDIKVLKLEIECKDIAIRELKKKLEIAQKKKMEFNLM